MQLPICFPILDILSKMTAAFIIIYGVYLFIAISLIDLLMVSMAIRNDISLLLDIYVLAN